MRKTCENKIESLENTRFLYGHSDTKPIAAVTDNGQHRITKRNKAPYNSVKTSNNS